MLKKKLQSASEMVVYAAIGVVSLYALFLIMLYLAPGAIGACWQLCGG